MNFVHFKCKANIFAEFERMNIIKKLNLKRPVESK